MRTVRYRREIGILRTREKMGDPRARARRKGNGKTRDRDESRREWSYPRTLIIVNGVDGENARKFPLYAKLRRPVSWRGRVGEGGGGRGESWTRAVKLLAKISIESARETTSAVKCSRIYSRPRVFRLQERDGRGGFYCPVVY